jgi:RNA polymerase sigma-70 factor (ECF subfamily)
VAGGERSANRLCTGSTDLQRWSQDVTTATTAPLVFIPALCETSGIAYSRHMDEALDDTALMLQYKEGDVRAFETLYRRHNDSLYRYLLRMCMNRDSAEDIYQDVWRKIIDSRMRYRPTAKFATFLYRVARNCFIDHTRRNKRYSMADPGCTDEIACTADAPDLATEKILLRRRLDEALTELPDEQRDAFLLHEEAGLGLESIAAVCGVSRETVKSRLRYANNKLRHALSAPTTNRRKQK